MKAAFIKTTGSPDCIHFAELPAPVPTGNQVLVRTQSVAVNPIDTYIRSGSVKANLPDPYIIGIDIAGIVEAVGPECTRYKTGDRVWGSNQGLAGRQGCFAELCSIGEQWLYPVPDGVSFEAAAAGAMVGITAHLGLFFHGSLKSGEVVFVNGGSGGVGSAVVQLAKAAGATVITSAGSLKKANECRAHGADYVIEYRTDDVDQRLAEITKATGPIHLWFETHRVPTPERSIPLMAMRGRLIFMAGRDARPILPLGPFYTRDLRAIGFAMFNASPDEQRTAASDLNRMLDAGHWKPAIGARFPLSQAAAAHRLQEENTLHGANTLTGKIVLNVEA
ncbi:MAG: NADPH:quinone reductase [Planctomycetaceae bacterium]